MILYVIFIFFNHIFALERLRSLASFHNVALTAPSIGRFVNEDSTWKDTINVDNALDRNPPTLSEVCDTPITITTTVVQKVRLSISTPSPDEDLQRGRNAAINIKVTIGRQTIKLNPLLLLFFSYWNK